ncbi:TetR/AcrR family transcriptional regulator [Sedimentibacter sp. MB31-C6]|uniref:TetR/AcrR family transcriptional regulator n=1 Tax=Sedimentibacter sp. MB31-C6 TaxID=3109366 RepID=UPI002DDC9B40|nr:TetR/AcrR family transcriptional regulator [Sedimentibacter sp. MB36-C1]WSI05297.1 TetR/AcrR family transcriptional regulator [Sedimentibacter sp. MB36-C1]
MKEKSFEKRTELLEAALDEFSVKKYEEASLNNIIKKASISKGTFYYHYKDKQELYLYLLESSVKTKWEFINNHFKESIEIKKDDIFEKFKLQARIGAEFAALYPKYHNLSKMLAKEKGNEIYNIAKIQLSGDSVNPLKKMIESAIGDGNFRDDIPSDFILKIISYMFSNFDEIFSNEEDLEINNIIKNLDYYVDFIKNGLGK